MRKGFLFRSIGRDFRTLDRGTGHDRQQCARAHQEQQDERQQSTIAQEHDTSFQHAKSVLPSKHNCLIEPVTYKTAFEPRIPNTKDKEPRKRRIVTCHRPPTGVKGAPPGHLLPAHFVSLRS
eukprot:scaffold142991_cov130-Phaeocystis_antarctica.AAC.6